MLTERVAEVEHINTTGSGIPLVLVGEIKKIEAIEGADKIQLTTVDVGKEELSIVCGAKNIHEGAKVPVALVDCVLPGDPGSGSGAGFKIEKRKVRGVESNGMICSEMELGLAEKSEGIMLLDKDAEVGQPFSAGEPSDVVFEIDNHAITHRPDLFGQLGFAREVAVLLGKKFEDRELALPEIKQKVDVEVAETKLCPRYSALRISGVKVQPSSQKIQDRLEACGIRAINNIVDATNYVMLELGEPMHAFDSKNIKGGWIIVRRAKKGEKMKTLDGEERKLSSEILVIADADKPVALAGVMGGENSEVDAKTKEIILEAATFDAANIRRTSIKLGLRSESSLRFEKRLDPELPPKAIARFVEILRETCPELKLVAAADVKNFETEKRVIKLSLSNLNKKLGIAVKEEKAKKILTALKFKVVGSGNELEVTVPSFRAGRDIEQEDDLIEEVVRHLGYKDLPSDFPQIRMESPERDRARELADESRDAMVGYGFHETCTLALVSEKLLKDANQKLERAVRLKNPPSEDHRYLRSSLLASLLDTASRNIHNQNAFKLFETATVFLLTGEESEELTYFTALVVDEENPYPQVRGVLESLLRDLKFKAELVEAVPVAATAHPGRTADVKIAGKKIGMLAELHPAVAQKFELPRAAFFCLDFEMLAAAPREIVVPEDLPRFPGVPRDLAVLVDTKTLTQDVENAISSADEKICDLKLFDIYTGKGIPEGQKSLAFSFEIRDPEKTLEDKESEEIVQKVVANLEEIGGKLRS